MTLVEYKIQKKISVYPYYQYIQYCFSVFSNGTDCETRYLTGNKEYIAFVLSEFQS